MDLNLQLLIMHCLLSRRLVLSTALAAALSPRGASAVQRYSFASLMWGDGLELVTQRLTASGYSSPQVFAPTFAGAAERGAFGATFTGQINRLPFTGFAAFEAKRLISITLEFTLDSLVYVEQMNDLRALLETRYGKGRIGDPSQSGARTVNVWGRTPGETLEFALFRTTRGPRAPERVRITYSSPESHRVAARARTQQEAEDKRRRAAEAAGRVKESAKL